MLLQVARCMFPEGKGRPVAAPKVSSAAPLINQLLYNTEAAIDKLWKERGYDPKKPAEIKAKLGYALDKYEAAAYVVTHQLRLPLLSEAEPTAMTIGKRITNITGNSGTIGAKLKVLRKRGKRTAPEQATLLRASAALSLEPPPSRKRTAPPPAPPPPPPPQPPPQLLPLPPPSVPVPTADAGAAPGINQKIDYFDAGDCSHEFWATERHPEIAGYRGRAGASDEERFWNPAAPPCVPSDHRPTHLFNSREAAEAAGMASRVEQSAPCPDEDGEDQFYDEEEHELACVQHKHAMSRLRARFPEASETHHTRPCPCGHGALAMWPWVVQTAQLGFCDCQMAKWERICWRSDWIAAGAPGLAW